MRPGEQGAAHRDDLEDGGSELPVKHGAVVVFRSDTVDRVHTSLDEVRKRFAGRPIALVCQQAQAQSFVHAHADVSVMTFAGPRFSLHDVGLTIVRKLRKLGVSDVVIPVRVSGVRDAVSEYSNLVALSAWLGLPRLWFRDSLGKWTQASWGRIVASLVSDIVGIVFVPVFLLRGLFDILRSSDTCDNPVVGYGGEPNDWLCHVTKAKWMGRYGVWGIALESYLGNPFSLMYPPLAIWLLRHLRVKWFVLVTLALHFVAFFGLACSFKQAWAWVLVLWVFGSPILKNALIRLGRVEVLGWAFVSLALLGLMHGKAVLTGVLLGAAMLVHPFPGALGTGLALVVGLRGAESIPRVAIAVGVMAAISAIWTLPFFLHGRKKLGFRKLRDKIPLFHLPSAILWSRVLVWMPLMILGISSGVRMPWLGALGVCLGMYGLLLGTKSYLFHPFSVDLAIVHAGFCMTVQSGSLWVAGAFLFGLYGLAIYGARSRYTVTPTYYRDHVECLKHLYSKAPFGARVALECTGNWSVDTPWSWLMAYGLDGERELELLSGVSSDQVEFELPYEYERLVNADTPRDLLNERLDRVAVTHVMAHTDRFAALLGDAGWKLVGDAVLGNAGTWPGRHLRLLARSTSCSKVEPATGLRRANGGLEIDGRADIAYLIKFAWTRGWRAAGADGHPLRIRDAAPGMIIACETDGPIRLQYSWLNYFRLRGIAT